MDEKRPSEIDDYYERLGVGRSVSKILIDYAYRVLAKKWHPDTNSDKNASEEFKAITEAYHKLIKSLDEREEIFKMGVKERIRNYERVERDIKAGRRNYYEDDVVIMRRNKDRSVHTEFK